jgi:cell division protein FtsB
MKRLLYLFIIFLIALSSYRLIDSFRHRHEINRLHREYLSKLEELKLERKRLKVQVEALKSDRFLQEELARKIGYGKPGERVYIIDEGK